MAKVGVVLSGCGVYDGAEIHEATLTLYFLDKAGAEILCMAPDINQMHVIDHTKGEPSTDSRNVLCESSRITRGEIRNMKEVKAADMDALIFPGGFGAAKNLCDFAVKGPDCIVNPEVARLIKEIHAAKVLGAANPTLTIGNDPGAAGAIEAMGGRHIQAPVEGIVVDEANRIVTTPAYMLGPTISKVAQGIEKLVAEILRMAKK